VCKCEQSHRGTQGCSTAEALNVREQDSISNPMAICANGQIQLQNHVTSHKAAQNDSIDELSLTCMTITAKQAVALAPLTENRVCRAEDLYTLLLHM